MKKILTLNFKYKCEYIHSTMSIIHILLPISLILCIYLGYLISRVLFRIYLSKRVTNFENLKILWSFQVVDKKNIIYT